MIILRRILFFIFFTTYLVVCPFLIFYALGYIVKPGPELSLAYTGLISIQTIPKGASVFLEGSRYSKKTPTTMMELLPGSYHLKVALKGLSPWTRTVQVQAGKAVVLEKIILLPKDLKPEIIVRE